MNLFSDSRIENKLRRIEAAQKLSQTGGKHRADSLPKHHRVRIAKKAAQARWNKNLQA